MLTRSLSFENGFAEAKLLPGIGAGVDTYGAGMVSIGSGLPAELVLAAVGAAAVSVALLSSETGDFGRGATSSSACLESESPLEMAGESGRSTWEDETLKVSTFLDEAFGGEGKSFGLRL